MKKLMILSLVLLISTAGFAQTEAEQEVRKAEREWLNAYEQNDTLMMDQLVADDFLIRYAQGTTETKADLLNMLRRNKANQKSPSLRFYTEGTTASVYVGTVVLRGIVVSEFEAAGEKKQVKQFYTDTWVRTEKGWQVVASHLTDVPAAGNSPAGSGKLRKKVG